MNPRRSISLDFIRVVGALGVVLEHAISPIVFNFHYFGTASWWILELLDAAVRVAVPLFIMVSGALAFEGIARKPHHYRWKRILRLGVPLFFFTACYFLWLRWFHGISLTPQRIAGDIGVLRISHLYFLPILLGLSICAPFLAKIFDPRDLPDYLAKTTLAFLVVGATVFYMFLTGSFYILKTILFICLLYLPYFVAGQWFKRVELSREGAKTTGIAWFFLVVLTAIVAYANWHFKWPFGKYGQYFFDHLSLPVIVATLLAFPGLSYISRRLPRGFSDKVLAVAPATFGIYLVHPFILDVIERFVKTPPGTFLLPVVFLKFIVTVVVSYLLSMSASRGLDFCYNKLCRSSNESSVTST